MFNIFAEYAWTPSYITSFTAWNILVLNRYLVNDLIILKALSVMVQNFIFFGSGARDYII